jgi:hypothetical protein
MTFFIILDNDPRCVWNYTLQCWASDVDAEYGRGFEYGSNRAVHRTAFNVKFDNPRRVVDVVARDQLFAMLEVRDWAGSSK